MSFVPLFGRLVSFTKIIFVYPVLFSRMTDGELAEDLKYSVNRSGICIVPRRPHNAEGSRDDKARFERPKIVPATVSTDAV